MPERPPLVERPRGEPDTSAGFLVLAWLWIGGCLFVSAMTAMVSDFCPAGWEKRLQADLCESRVNRVWMALLIGQLIIVGIAVLGTVLGRSALVGVAMAMAPLAIIAALFAFGYATDPSRLSLGEVIPCTEVVFTTGWSGKAEPRSPLCLSAVWPLIDGQRAEHAARHIEHGVVWP